MTGRAKLLLSVMAGALFALAAPPTNFYPGLWLGMAGLAFAVDGSGEHPKTRKGRWFHGGLRGLAFGTAANVVALRFVPDVIARFTPLPWTAGVLALLLLSIEQSTRWAVLGIVAIQLGRRGVPRWLAFGMGIFAGTYVPVVFPWTPAGGVTPYPELVQLADIVGERGVTLVMALTSAFAAEAVRLALAGASRRHVAGLAVLTLTIPAACWGYGALRIRDIEALERAAPHATVGLVQAATEATERWDESRAAGILDRLTVLTRTSEARGAELTVWPEAAYPYPVAATARYDLIGPWAILQPGVHGPVLAGLVMKGNDGSHNSALIASGGTLSPPYHKMHLLAFGEGVPLADVFPWLRTTFARGLGLVPGDHQVPLESGRIRAAVLNCFEDTLPEASREAMDVSPNLLVNITNDAWFYGSQESELHLRLSALRAVEIRRDLVRAVNRGPTSWVLATGRVRARASPDFANVLIAEPSLLTGRTIYAKLGDWPLLALLAVLGSVLLARTKRNGRGA